MGFAAAKMKIHLPADAAIDAEVDLCGAGASGSSELASTSACRAWSATSLKPLWMPRIRRVLFQGHTGNIDVAINVV